MRCCCWRAREVIVMAEAASASREEVGEMIWEWTRWEEEAAKRTRRPCSVVRTRWSGGRGKSRAAGVAARALEVARMGSAVGRRTSTATRAEEALWWTMRALKVVASEPPGEARPRFSSWAKARRRMRLRSVVGAEKAKVRQARAGRPTTGGGPSEDGSSDSRHHEGELETRHNSQRGEAAGRMTEMGVRGFILP
jgi:hypothetical protein